MASVLAWGARGREFESHHSDETKEVDQKSQPLFLFSNDQLVPTAAGKVVREFIPAKSGSLTTPTKEKVAAYVVATFLFA
jgi:hypothetical protein